MLAVVRTHGVSHGFATNPEARAFVRNHWSPSSGATGFAALVDSENIRPGSRDYQNSCAPTKRGAVSDKGVINHLHVSRNKLL